MVRKEEIEKLSEYMKENDYVIVPGKYIINQADNFEKLKGRFDFIKN